MLLSIDILLVLVLGDLHKWSYLKIGYCLFIFFMCTLQKSLIYFVILHQDQYCHCNWFLQSKTVSGHYILTKEILPSKRNICRYVNWYPPIKDVNFIKYLPHTFGNHFSHYEIFWLCAGYSFIIQVRFLCLQRMQSITVRCLSVLHRAVPRCSITSLLSPFERPLHMMPIISREVIGKPILQVYGAV